MAQQFGTEGSDFFTASNSEWNQIWGYGGNDRLIGGSTRDWLFGGAGNDHLEGGDGMDFIYTGTGNDFVLAGDGNDTVYSEGGNDTIYAGYGSDTVNIDRQTNQEVSTIFVDTGPGSDDVQFNNYNGSDLTLHTGGGRDRVTIYGGTGGTTSIDLGIGDDKLQIALGGAAYELTLGDGQDTIQVLVNAQTFTELTAIVITDFQTGVGGDIFNLNSSEDTQFLLQELLSDWDGGNPFASGHLSLVQRGADTVLMVDRNGGGDSYVDFVVFQNTDASAFTDYNLAYDPSGADPVETYAHQAGIGDDFVSAVSAEINTGSGDDFIDLSSAYNYQRTRVVAGAGNDTIVVGGNAYAVIELGSGDDTVFGGSYYTTVYSNDSGADNIIGGSGRDYVAITRAEDAEVDYIQARGYDGNDSLRAYLYNPSTALLSGGAGNDYLLGAGTDGKVLIRAGAGMDFVFAQLHGVDVDILLGAGADQVGVYGTPGVWTTEGTIEVRDFDVTEDMVVTEFLVSYLGQGYDGQANPFTAGFVRVIDGVTGAELQFDVDGAAGPEDFVSVMTLVGVAASDLTDANFDFGPSGAMPAGVDLIDPPSSFVTGTDGDDYISLYFATYNTTAYGYFGADEIYGGFGDDAIYGGEGDDRIFGQDGDDHLYGERGNDLIVGGFGDDTVYDYDGNDVMYGEFGRDRLEIVRSQYVEVSSSAMYGGNDDDVLLFTSDNGSSAIMRGEQGNDLLVIRGTSGFASANGGFGDDTIDILLSGVRAFVNFGVGADRLDIHGDATNPVVAQYLTLVDFDATTGDTAYLGEYFDEMLQGWDGKTNPFASGYARVIQQGADALVQVDIDGGANSFATLIRVQNTLVDNLSFDALGFETGAYSRTGTAGDDILYGSFGINTLAGLDGNDTIFGNGGDDVIEGGNGNDALHGGSGRDAIVGGAGMDMIYGGAGADTLEGGDGDDLIDGGYENDLIFGGAGNDRLRGEVGNDILYGGAGQDEMRGGDNFDQLYGGADNDTLYGERGDDLIFGDDGDDLIFGGPGNDILDGGYGDDRVFGGADADTIRGDAGRDMLYGEDGDDVISGGAGADMIYGGAMADTLSGDAGDDELFGGAGNDVLIGGAGNDRMSGGDGADRFVFDFPLGAQNVDLILDFDANDTIVLDGSVFAALGQQGMIAEGAFHIGTMAEDADDRIIYNDATGEIFYDADGAGGAEAVLFARVQVGTVLDASDFEVGPSALAQEALSGADFAIV